MKQSRYIVNRTAITFRDLSVGKYEDINIDTNKKLMEGFIYILSNPSLPGVYKIGLTSRNPSERVKELSSSTSIPTSFVLEDAWHTNDLANTEREIHEHLSSSRVNNQREFFKGDLELFKDVLQEFCSLKRGESRDEFHNTFQFTSSKVTTDKRVNISITRETFDSLSLSSQGDINMIVDGMINMVTKAACNIHFTDDEAIAFESAVDEHQRSYTSGLAGIQKITVKGEVNNG